MSAFLEVRTPQGTRRVELTGEEVTIGRAPTNNIAIPSDRRVGRTHARLERRRAGWTLRDLGVAGGTSVNGKRVWSEIALSPGDEVHIGETVLVFDAPENVAGVTLTRVFGSPPVLTAAERSLLEALCAPLVMGDAFTEPLSVDELCAVLERTRAGVEATLARLYEKFGIFDEGDRRRMLLAHEAVSRGSILLIPSGDGSGQREAEQARKPAPPSKAGGGGRRDRSATRGRKKPARKRAATSSKGAAARSSRAAKAKRAVSGAGKKTGRN